MPKIEPTKIYILEIRRRIILRLHKEGHNHMVISQIMNIEKSWISRIIRAKNVKVPRYTQGK